MRIFLIFTIITLSVCLCEAQWVRANGPLCPDISCFASSGTNIFTGTFEGVFLSTDDGMSWNATGLDTSINTLAVSGTTLLAGSYSYGLFFSTNDGKDWTSINNDLPNYAGILSVAMIGKYWFAGCHNGGIFRSTNKGTNWTEVNSGPGVSAFLAVDTSLFAVTTSGIYRTTDYGATWVHADSGLTPNT